MTQNIRTKIYLAAPLFNPLEREFNQSLAEKLGDLAEVFLPQRDGALLTSLVRNGMPVDSARHHVFKVDKNAIQACDLIVAVLDGRTIDEGVAFEIGYANALGKICIALKTDDRSMLPTGDNPMIVAACNEIACRIDELVLRVEHYCRGDVAADRDHTAQSSLKAEVIGKNDKDRFNARD